MTDILNELKTKTRPYHDEIEQYVNLMDPDMNREKYGRLLQLFYGFYGPMEQLAETRFSKETLDQFNFEKRQKSAWLLSDLKAMGLEPNLSRQPEMPVVETFSQLLGAFYVMEGATLGGQHIARHLNKLLGLTPENGSAFFSSYRENVGAMWQAYQAELTKSEEPGVIVDSACETFGKFNAWFKVNQVAHAN